MKPRHIKSFAWSYLKKNKMILPFVLAIAVVMLLLQMWYFSKVDQECSVAYRPFVHNGMHAVTCDNNR